MKNTDYIPGEFESSKFVHMKDACYQGVDEIKSLGCTTEDFINFFPCFSGNLTLARYLSLFECYKSTLGVAGHLAEIGMFKGACSLLFAKLVQLYETSTLTQVHGFDWFKGVANLTAEERKSIVEGSYHEPKERVEALVKAQRLDHILKIHDMDMASDAVAAFFERHKHLQFKLVFFDAGLYDVVRTCLPHFWERLTPGGMLVFDQYNFDVAPGETRAVREFLPHAKIRSFPHGWMPTAYVVKE